MLDKKIAALRAEAIYACGRGVLGKQGGDLQKLEQARANIFNSEARFICRACLFNAHVSRSNSRGRRTAGQQTGMHDK